MNHLKICKDHTECKIEMPKPGKNILKFRSHYMKSPLPFTIYADFETVNIPLPLPCPKVLQRAKYHQQALSYSWKLVSKYPTINTPESSTSPEGPEGQEGTEISWLPNQFKLFRGTSPEETLKEFQKDMLKLNKSLWYKLRPDHKWNATKKKFDIISNMIPLTEQEEEEFKKSTNCDFCNCIFDVKTTEEITLKRMAKIRSWSNSLLCK